MREIRTSGSMSGDGKRGVGHRPQATAPILDSTVPADWACPLHVGDWGEERTFVGRSSTLLSQ
jgi:hypothetical protein